MPCDGEDNHYVYGELLGMSSQDIIALADEGVIYSIFQLCVWTCRGREGSPYSCLALTPPSPGGRGGINCTPALRRLPKHRTRGGTVIHKN
jgi:hypothetical protein